MQYSRPRLKSNSLTAVLKYLSITKDVLKEFRYCLTLHNPDSENTRGVDGNAVPRSFRLGLALINGNALNLL